MMVTKTHTKNIPNDIVVIIPTYNESTNISTLLDKLSMAHEVFDILIVDDNSPDGTSKIVEENYVRNLKTIHLLKRDQKFTLALPIEMVLNGPLKNINTLLKWMAIFLTLLMI